MLSDAYCIAVTLYKDDPEPNGKKEHPKPKAKASGNGAKAKAKPKATKDNKEVIKPAPKSKTTKKYELTSYGLAKKDFDEKPLGTLWCLKVDGILNLRPRFHFDGGAKAKGRRAAMEAAWLASRERKKVLKDMPIAEQKRRKYI